MTRLDSKSAREILTCQDHLEYRFTSIAINDELHAKCVLGYLLIRKCEWRVRRVLAASQPFHNTGTNEGSLEAASSQN